MARRRADSRATTEPRAAERPSRPRLARGTSQNDALDTKPFQRPELDAVPRMISGPESRTVIVDPPLERALADLAENPEPARLPSPPPTAWDPEATSSTATQLVRFRPDQTTWLGIALAPPEVGAAIVIGTWLRPDFRITSPVTKLMTRDDGVLVQTTTNSRYFIANGGDAYLVKTPR